MIDKQNKTISDSLEILYDVAEKNPDGHDIRTAVGEVSIDGIVYQIQLSLVADKRVWLGEVDVSLYAVVNIHE